MKLIETLADIETIMRYMNDNDIAEVQVENLVIKARGKAAAAVPVRSITDEDVLMNPYAGLKV